MKPPMPPEQAALRRATRSLEAARQQAEEFPEFAASRAYYAMFYAATAMLLERGKRFKTHNGVIAAFGLEFAKSDPSWQRHHERLRRAERHRLEADYDLFAEFDAAKAQEIVAWAEEFLAAAQQALAAK